MAANQISRRSVLAGLGAVTAGGAVGAATAASSLGENEALLDAWAAFNSALAVFDAASAAKTTAIAEFNAMAPAVPDALRCQNSTTLANGLKARGYIAERLQDADGNEVHDDRRGYVWVVDSHQLSKYLLWQDGRLTATRMLRALLPLAQLFEAERAAAMEAAGVSDAKEAFWRADSAMRTAVERITLAEARTPQGLAIKARAITAAISRNSEYAWTFAANGQKLAEAINGVLGGLVHG